MGTVWNGLRFERCAGLQARHSTHVSNPLFRVENPTHKHPTLAAIREPHGQMLSPYYPESVKQVGGLLLLSMT